MSGFPRRVFLNKRNVNIGGGVSKSGLPGGVGTPAMLKRFMQVRSNKAAEAAAPIIDDGDITDGGSIVQPPQGITTFGSGTIITKDPSGICYIEDYTLTASDRNVEDYLGCSVAIYGDYIVAGAYAADDDDQSNGALYVYKKENGTFGTTINTSDPNGQAYIQKYKLIASDKADQDYLGFSVAINSEYIVAGAYRKNVQDDDNGVVYIYKKKQDGSFGILSGSTYVEDYKLIASDKKDESYLGWSVAINDDYIVVGSPKADNNSETDVGVVYVYNKNVGDDSFGVIKTIGGTTYYAENYKLGASDADGGELLGTSVAVNSNFIATGAYKANVDDANNGAIYVYEKHNTEIFGKQINAWQSVETQKLIASDHQDESLLGHSIAANDTYLVSGAYAMNTNGLDDNGITYVYKKTNEVYGDACGNYFVETYKLKPSNPDNGDYFGYSVALSDNYIVSSSYGKDIADTNNGTLYI